MCANIAATQSSDSQEWGTPDWLFNKLNQEFYFTVDAAATAENTKCTRYFTKENNGLTQDWENEIVWVNPPYNAAAEWYAKAYKEAILERATVVLLVAARTDTRYWWQYAIRAEIRFLKGRLKFIGGKYSAPFPSAIVVFHRDMKLRTPTTLYWEIKE